MRLDGDELKEALEKAQQALDGVRALAEPFVRSRLQQVREWSSVEEDEVVEKVFQQIGRAITTYDPQRLQNPFSWFATVVDHYLIDYCRTHRITVDSLDRPAVGVKADGDEQVAEEPPDRDSLLPSQDYEIGEARSILVRAMSRLSSPNRRAMLLFVTFYPELTHAQIAKAMGGLSENAAKQLKYNTMKEMRKILTEMGYSWKMFGEAFAPDKG